MKQRIRDGDITMKVVVNSGILRGNNCSNEAFVVRGMDDYEIVRGKAPSTIDDWNEGS
jgi:hypothetical protein